MAEPVRAQNVLNLITFLKETAFFAEVEESMLTYLVNDFRVRNYRKGDIIFHQGDESRSLFIVIEGKVRVYHLTAGGEETTVTILASRQLLGEFSLIDGQPRSATAQAITASRLLEMAGTRVMHHLTHIPGLALAMCRQIVHKARWTTMYAETIARFDAAGRLLHFLLLYNTEFGQALEPGKCYLLDLGLNQSDLATLVGAQRGWVNHILGEWRKRGLIEFEDGKITILDLNRVQQERDSRIIR